ncbi:hypothetical protein Cadr_000008103 [Camelus dromedarius]|uniref:Secreted protein n=1 Tax=Camelus dromedarius TaxID=9838 RepID=A0A5N4E039_CAMDR|nr:hypothetical protein Cadr_000008103 [Camelus dromedarius]
MLSSQMSQWLLLVPRLVESWAGMHVASEGARYCGWLWRIQMTHTEDANITITPGNGKYNNRTRWEDFEQGRV